MATGELLVAKVQGEETVADGLTKHVDRQMMEQQMVACGLVRPSSRHELCPRFGNGK